MARAWCSTYTLLSVTGLLVAAVSDKAAKNHTTFAASPDEDARYAYVGTKKCRSCHGKWHESWEAAAKGRSWDALKPLPSGTMHRASRP